MGHSCRGHIDLDVWLVFTTPFAAHGNAMTYRNATSQNTMTMTEPRVTPSLT